MLCYAIPILYTTNLRFDFCSYFYCVTEFLHTELPVRPITQKTAKDAKDGAKASSQKIAVSWFWISDQCSAWTDVVSSLMYPFERITCSRDDAVCRVLLAFLCRSHDSVVLNTRSREKFVQTYLLEAYLTLHNRVCASLLFGFLSKLSFRQIPRNIRVSESRLNHTNYNRIRLLQFCVHISAKLLLLRKKVIYLFM